MMELAEAIASDKYFAEYALKLGRQVHATSQALLLYSTEEQMSLDSAPTSTSVSLGGSAATGTEGHGLPPPSELTRLSGASESERIPPTVIAQQLTLILQRMRWKIDIHEFLYVIKS